MVKFVGWHSLLFCMVLNGFAYAQSGTSIDVSKDIVRGDRSRAKQEAFDDLLQTAMRRYLGGQLSSTLISQQEGLLKPYFFDTVQHFVSDYRVDHEGVEGSVYRISA